MGLVANDLPVPSRHAGVEAAIRQVRIDVSGRAGVLADAMRDGAGPVPPGHLCADSVVVARRAGQVLLMRHHLVGWIFPGGHVHTGEAPAAAAARELAEETGVRVPVQDGHAPLALYDTAVGECSTSAAHHHWSLAYLCVSDEPTSTEASSEGAVHWFPLERLPRARFWAVEPVLHRLMTEHRHLVV